MPNQGGTRDKTGQQVMASRATTTWTTTSSVGSASSKRTIGSAKANNRGGSGNFAEDPGKASEAGRKGGQS